MSEDDAGPSDEMAAIMGFSGFGSKKKWQTATVEHLLEENIVPWRRLQSIRFEDKWKRRDE